MASFQNLPNGSRVLVVRDPQTGLVQQIGAAQLPNGNVCPCQNSQNGWMRSDMIGCAYRAISARDAASIAMQMSQGSAGRGNTFSNVNVPNQGPVGLSNRQMPGSPTARNQIFTLVLDNTAGATAARKFLGDINGTYALLGNTELTPVGFTVGGTWTTNSLSQLIAMTGRRPWSIDQIQFIASVETYFNLAVNNYFDTNPSRDSPTVDNLVLTSLLSPQNFNNKIQFYSKELYLDGVNGLDIAIPAGQSITLQISITAVGKATNQVNI